MDTESLMKFDYSVGTEERFAFRKWLQKWVDQFQEKAKDQQNLALSDEFLAIGFSELPLGTDGFQSFWDNLTPKKQKLVLKLDEASITYSNYIYSLSGNLEIFIDGIICFSGGLKCQLKAADDSFEFVRMKFYPRMSMRVEP